MKLSLSTYLEPYYIVARLPEEEREEFLLMLPFTPSGKDNMIAWLAARSDVPQYGELVVFKLPKDKLIFGPMQIESRVDQQPEISSQLTLWGQRGSRVIRGNLLAIPVEGAFLYVEPVYLEARPEERAPEMAPETAPGTSPPGSRPQARPWPRRASTTALPELKQVIVAFGNRLAMRNTLDEALEAIFGEKIARAEEEPPQIAPFQAAAVGDLASSARAHYRKAREYLRTWKWTEFGAEMDKLEESLRVLDETVGRGK